MKDFDEFEIWWETSDAAEGCRDELRERMRSEIRDGDPDADPRMVAIAARSAYERRLPLLMLRKYHEWASEG